jgi:hypothetical protein
MADAKDLCELADVTVPPEKHTPGPWKIEPRHIEGLFVSGADNIHSVVAQIRVYPDAPDESASNASLIAMAPALLESHARLLEALRSALAAIYVLRPELAKYEDAFLQSRLEWVGADTFDPHRTVRRLLEIRAAIAAAEKLAVSK